MIDTPNPRLPLEPEEYPLYSPPKRVGCSALAILPIILIAIFVFLFFRVTPNMAQGMVNPVRQIFGIELPTEVPAAGVISSSRRAGYADSVRYYSHCYACSSHVRSSHSHDDSRGVCEGS